MTIKVALAVLTQKPFVKICRSGYSPSLSVVRPGQPLIHIHRQDLMEKMALSVCREAQETLLAVSQEVLDTKLSVFGETCELSVGSAELMEYGIMHQDIQFEFTIHSRLTMKIAKEIEEARKHKYGKPKLSRQAQMYLFSKGQQL